AIRNTFMFKLQRRIIFSPWESGRHSIPQRLPCNGLQVPQLNIQMVRAGTILPAAWIRQMKTNLSLADWITIYLQTAVPRSRKFPDGLQPITHGRMPIIITRFMSMRILTTMQMMAECLSEQSTALL